MYTIHTHIRIGCRYEAMLQQKNFPLRSVAGLILVLQELLSAWAQPLSPSGPAVLQDAIAAKFNSDTVQ